MGLLGTSTLLVMDLVVLDALMGALHARLVLDALLVGFCSRLVLDALLVVGASSIIPSLLKRICLQIHCLFFFMARGMDAYGWMVSIISSFLRKSILRSTVVISNSSLLLLQLCLSSRIELPSRGIIK